MNRWLAILAVLFAAFVTAGAITLYLAYGISQAPPRQSTVPDLEGRVRIGWNKAGHTLIEADSEADRYAALGFVHGSQHTWSVVLWRQVGLGGLSQWFGSSTLPIDRFTHTLGIAATAHQAFAGLNESERRLLTAYAAGLDAALRTRSSALNREVSLLNVVPDPWEPWHILVIERLIAWLSVPAESIELPTSAPEEAHRFVKGDRALRSFLHLHGFEDTVAWTMRDSTWIVLMQRHVLGASALPVFSEVSFASGDTITLEGASLPGTPFFPAARSTDVAWAIMMSSRAQWAVVSEASVRTDTAYSRIRLRQGDELLVRTPRTANALAFSAPAYVPIMHDTTAPTVESPVVDSLWLLAWPGLLPLSDVGAWRALLDGSFDSFSMQEGAGLSMREDGSVNVLGQPRIARAWANGTLVGNNVWSDFLANHLDSLALASEGIVGQVPLLDDCYSTWAASLAPLLLGSISRGFRHARVMEDALTYLRNWDFTYDRMSIAASIFDTWLRTHRDSTGALPHPAHADTSMDARFRLYASLTHAINRLGSSHGPDLSEWRWEVVAPRNRYYPVWSADTLPQIERSVLSTTRYAPVELLAQGHPSSLCWGPSLVSHSIPAPEVWEAWISTGSWNEMFVRRRRLDHDAFLARYRISHEKPDPLVLSTSVLARRETILVPGGVETP